MGSRRRPAGHRRTREEQRERDCSPIHWERGLSSKAQGIQALVEFRDRVIKAEDEQNWKCIVILRDELIETFVSEHFTNRSMNGLRRCRLSSGRPPIR